MATFRRCKWIALLVSGLVFAGISQSAQAQVVWIGTTNDVLLGSNWVGGAVPAATPAAVQEARFSTGGSHTPDLSGNWNVRYAGWDDPTGAAYTLGGTGTLTIGAPGAVTASNGNIDTYLNKGDVTINVANIVMNRASEIYAASTAPGTGNLIINSSTLKMGQGTGTGAAVNIHAVGGNVTIAPSIDFNGQDTRNRTLTLIPSAGKTITLTGGVMPAPRAFRITANGEAGGRSVLGDSTTYAGGVLINNSDLEINHNTSLGSTEPTLGWTAIASGLDNSSNNGSATGALVLTNNLTDVGEYIFLGSRTSLANPVIKNKSGDNTLSGTIQTDDVAASTQHNYPLQSDGTAGGDILRISGTLQTSPLVDLGGASNLSLQGAGPGSVTGNIVELNGNIWNLEKNGLGTWTLSGANMSYSGTTTVNQGTLAISGSGWFASTGGITVKAGATLNLSGLPGSTYTLGGAQTLKGAGAIVGSIVSNSGSIIVPGDSAGTLHITGNLTLGGGILQFELSNSPAGINDKIFASGALSVLGPTTIDLNALSGTLGSGDYRLIDYTGPAIANANTIFTPSGFTPSPRQSMSFTSVANQLNLHITGNPGNLTWVGGLNSNAWDLNATVNWTGETNSHFFDGDIVTFTDTGSNSPNVNIIGNLSPASVTFSNTSAHSYTLGGGTLDIGGGLTTSSSGNVTFSNADVSTAGINAAGSGNLTFVNANVSVTDTFTVNGTGKVTIANTGNLSLPATIAVNSGTLALNRTDDITVTNAITGAGTLRKEGANVVTASGDNSGFTGAITVAAGTLKVSNGNANALGTGAGGTTVVGGATLDLNGTSFASEVVTIAGNGVGGIGSLYDSNTTDVVSHINGIVMSADATVGLAVNTYIYVDGAGATFQGNGHNLSVAGASSPSRSELDLVGVGNTNLNNINVTNGVLYLGSNTTLGPTSGTLTLKDSGRLGIYASLEPTSPSTGLIDKPIVVENTTNGGGIEVYRGNKTISSPITMNGNLEVTTRPRDSNTTSTVTLTGKLTGAGNLTVHSDGTTTVSRLGMVELTNDANNYSGTTNIGGGGSFVIPAVTSANDRIALSIGNGGTTGKLGVNGLGEGIVTVTDRGVLAFNLNKTYSFSNVNVTNVSGTGGVSYLADNGVVTPSGTISYSGLTTIEHGTVVLNANNASNALGDTTGTTTLRGGSGGRTARLQLDGSAGSVINAENISISGYGGASNLLGADGLITNVAGDNELSGTLTLIGGSGSSYIASKAGTLRLSGNIALGSTTRSLFVGGASNGTISGAIQDATAPNVVGLEKIGAGTWSVTNGANTYTGATIVRAGALRLAQDAITFSEGSISSSGLILVHGGATLDVTGRTDQTLALAGTNPILAGTGTIAGNVTSVPGATITPSGTAILPTHFGYSANLANGTMSIGGQLNLAGSDTVMFELGPNTASGNDKIVHSGALNLGGSNTNVLIVPGGGTLATGAYTVIDGAVSQASGGGAFQIDATHNTRYNFTLNNTTPGKLIVNVSGTNANLTWSGGVSNNWNVKADANWTGAGDGQFFQGDAVTFNDSSTNVNNVTITEAVNPVSITVSGTRDYTFDGTGRITGSGGIVKNGTGTLTIANSGGNDYTGAVTINNGILKVGTGYALGGELDGVAGGDAGTTINSGGTLDLNGNSPIVEQLSAQGAGFGGIGAIVNNSTDGQTISYLTLMGDTTLGGSGAWELAAQNANDAYLPGYLHGNARSITKVGAGQVSLSNLGNSNLANLNVNTGILRLAGNTSIGNNVSTVNVAAGATLNVADLTGGFVVGGGSAGQVLKGNGAVIGNVTIGPNGNLQPGASVGTLAVTGNVSINGTMGIEVSGTTIDLLNVTGGLTLGGSSVLDIQGNLATAVTHVIATYNPGALVGTFANALDATSNGYNVVYGSSQITLDELDGDANHDGTVNIFDINLVSANWSPVGPVAAFAPGNTNHDTVINIFDINLISANWNHVATNGGPAHAQAVPEPSSIALAALGLAGLVMFVRRRRN